MNFMNVGQPQPQQTFNPFFSSFFNFQFNLGNNRFYFNNLIEALRFIELINSNNIKEIKEIKRNESIEVKSDVDRILRDNKELKEKDNDVQTIINIIPFTIVKNISKNNSWNCLICLSNYQIGEKVSALPCCHTFHTKCLDKWLVMHLRCPVCNFKLTVRNIVGTDYIKEQLEKVRKEINEREAKMIKEDKNNK